MFHKREPVDAGSKSMDDDINGQVCAGYLSTTVASHSTEDTYIQGFSVTTAYYQEALQFSFLFHCQVPLIPPLLGLQIRMRLSTSLFMLCGNVLTGKPQASFFYIYYRSIFE